MVFITATGVLITFFHRTRNKFELRTLKAFKIGTIGKRVAQIINTTIISGICWLSKT